MSSPSGCAKLANIQEDISHANKLSKMKSSHTDKEVESTPKIPKAKKNISSDAQPENIGSKKLTRRPISSEKKLTDACKSKSSSSNDTEDESKEEESLSSSVSIDRPSSTTGEHMYSSSRYEKIEAYHALPANEKVGSIPNLPQNARNGLKTSVRKVVQQFKSSKQLKSNLSGRGEEIVGKYKVIVKFVLIPLLVVSSVIDWIPILFLYCIIDR